MCLFFLTVIFRLKSCAYTTEREGGRMRRRICLSFWIERQMIFSSSSLFPNLCTVQSFIANKCPCRNRRRCTNNMLISQAGRFFSFVIQTRRVRIGKEGKILTSHKLVTDANISCDENKKSSSSWFNVFVGKKQLMKQINVQFHSPVYLSVCLTVCDLSRDVSQAHQMVLPVWKIDGEINRRLFFS